MDNVIDLKIKQILGKKSEDELTAEDRILFIERQTALYEYPLEKLGVGGYTIPEGIRKGFFSPQEKMEAREWLDKLKKGYRSLPDINSKFPWLSD